MTEKMKGGITKMNLIKKDKNEERTSASELANTFVSSFAFGTLTGGLAGLILGGAALCGAFGSCEDIPRDRKEIQYIETVYKNPMGNVSYEGLNRNHIENVSYEGLNSSSDK